MHTVDEKSHLGVDRKADIRGCCAWTGGGEVCTLLTVATLGGVLACLLRHFRASLASLPLLGQPLGGAFD